MGDYYLAVDIGASSGRHILASAAEDGTLRMEEVYRFENGLTEKNGHMCWDTKYLFSQILAGMKQCREIGKIPKSMGIDTWAVDFVLLDADGSLIGDSVGYRDSRTAGMDEVVYRTIPQEELYARTGIQKQIFNTIYQLTAVRETAPEQLKEAAVFLMIPDYFNYLLTGVSCAEYTNATTTQLVNAETKDWDYEILERLGFPADIFPGIALPGTGLGGLKEEVRSEVGYDLEVVLPATHDTGSAVVAVPAREKNSIYISSGTWSLMGIEREKADTSKAGMDANFTNEGGYDYRFRYLKNIMGLWMIQSVRREYGKAFSFAQLCEMAGAEDSFPSRVDVNDQSFLAPESMLYAVMDYCRKTGQKLPVNPGQVAAIIYQSLAESYAQTVQEIEKLTGVTYESIYLVGGGSNASYLNRLTAKATGKRVFAGPQEATAIGNILVQMLKDKVYATLEEAREAVYRSFRIKEEI